MKGELFKKIVEPKIGSDLIVIANDNLVTIHQVSSGGMVGITPHAVTELCAVLLTAAKAAKQAREKRARPVQLSPIAGREIQQLTAPVSSDAAISKDL